MHLEIREKLPLASFIVSSFPKRICSLLQEQSRPLSDHDLGVAMFQGGLASPPTYECRQKLNLKEFVFSYHSTYE